MCQIDISSRPADFIRKPPSARLMSQFEFLLPTLAVLHSQDPKATFDKLDSWQFRPRIRLACQVFADSSRVLNGRATVRKPNIPENMRRALPGATGSITVAGSTATLTITRLEDALLTKAQELITKGDKDDFRIAVVVAHMACEISAERAILRAFVARGIEYCDENYPNFNLASSRPCNLYNAVTGNHIHKQPFWKPFKMSATRRNKVVHKGKPVTKAEAEASYKAASDLVAYLK